MPIQIGDRFGRLVVIGIGPHIMRKTPVRGWLCLCDCGKTKLTGTSNLICGGIKSCGCLRVEKSRVNALRHGHGRGKTVGISKTYQAWIDMKRRCCDPSRYGYEHYGGRGITVSSQFDTFDGFLSVLGECPSGLTLGRIDNDGNYEPGNVRWETWAEQVVNKRTNRKITFNGITRCAAEWSRLLNLPHSRLLSRIRAGWSDEDAITKPLQWHPKVA